MQRSAEAEIVMTASPAWLDQRHISETDLKAETAQLVSLGNARGASDSGVLA